jgi:hypothetical protein
MIILCFARSNGNNVYIMLLVYTPRTSEGLQVACQSVKQRIHGRFWTSVRNTSCVLHSTTEITLSDISGFGRLPVYEYWPFVIKMYFRKCTVVYDRTRPITTFGSGSTFWKLVSAPKKFRKHLQTGKYIRSSKILLTLSHPLYFVMSKYHIMGYSENDATTWHM